MGVMPERIGKGGILERLDRRYSTQGKRQFALGRLKNLANAGKNVAQLGAEDDNDPNDPSPPSRTVLTQPEKTHIEAHWFGQGGGGWWQAPHVEHVLRHGLITALEEAVVRNVPIKTLWICSGDPTNAPFETYVYPTNEQVTFILFSPSLPNSNYGDPAGAPTDDIWVVKRIRNVPETNGKLDGHKDGDMQLLDLGEKIEIVKRKPKRP